MGRQSYSKSKLLRTGLSLQQLVLIESPHSPSSSDFTAAASAAVIKPDTVSREEAWSLWERPADESGLTGLCEAVRRGCYPETQRVNSTSRSRSETGTMWRCCFQNKTSLQNFHLAALEDVDVNLNKWIPFSPLNLNEDYVWNIPHHIGVNIQYYTTIGCYYCAWFLNKWIRVFRPFT